MDVLLLFLLIVAALFVWLGRLLGRWLPRFSAGCAGPGLMLFSAYLAIAHRKPFDVSGSSAIPLDPTPVVYGLFLILLALMGLSAWVTGWRRRLPDALDEARPSEQSSETDFSRYVPGGGSSLTPWRIVMFAWILLLLLTMARMVFARGAPGV